MKKTLIIAIVTLGIGILVFYLIRKYRTPRLTIENFDYIQRKGIVSWSGISVEFGEDISGAIQGRHDFALEFVGDKTSTSFEIKRGNKTVFNSVFQHAKKTDNLLII